MDWMIIAHIMTILAYVTGIVCIVSFVTGLITTKEIFCKISLGSIIAFGIVVLVASFSLFMNSLSFS